MKLLYYFFIKIIKFNHNIVFGTYIQIWIYSIIQNTTYNYVLIFTVII